MTETGYRGGIFTLTLLALATVLAAVTAVPAADSTEVEHLRAFTRLYGYVRFFHPTDEVASANWLLLAYQGVEAVRETETTAELEQALYDLFLPVAPTLQLERVGAPKSQRKLSAAVGVDPAQIVAWQHLGVGLQPSFGIYDSVRTRRPGDLPSTNYSFLGSGVGAIEHRGRELRLRAAVMTTLDGVGGGSQLYLAVYRTGGELGFYDEMDDRPITDDQWAEYEIVGEIAADAVEISFGGLLIGHGTAWFDAFELSVRDPGGEWLPVAVINGGFEDDPEQAYGWYTSDWYEAPVTVDGTRAYDGDFSLNLLNRPVVPSRMFEQVPAPEEAISERIGAGLRCVLPLALIDASPFDRPQPFDIKNAPLDLELLSPGEPEWLATVVIAWNVFQHFYPYFDVIDTDWEAELTAAIEGTLDAESEAEFLRVLQRMVAALQDGHGNVYRPAVSQTTGWLPLRAVEVDGEIVVSASLIADFEPGDIIGAVDGVAAAELLADQLQYISGSEQWKRARALVQFGQGEYGSTAVVTIDRAGETLDVEVDRGFSFNIGEDRPEAIEELHPGVFYVDLSRAEMAEIYEVIEELAAADGVVFDLRGYPDGNHSILHHLTDEPIQSARWNISQMIYPDQERIAGWDTGGRWFLEPRQPRFQGRIVFLTDARAISYAESVMGIVEAYQLGDIVGRATAGANGNINPFTVFSSSFIWTGMKVLKHDGSQHHLIGILPTVPIEWTVEGLRAGRDEDLEAALELISGG